MMKYMKKLASLVLALIMVLGLGTGAFAKDDDEITNQDTYEIYQIFTGEYHDGVLSNVKWGQNGNIPVGKTVGDAVDSDTLTALTAVTSTASNKEKLKVITNYVDLTSNPYTTGNGTTYTVPNGYYLVKNRDDSQTGTDSSYTTYVVEVVNETLSFNPKSHVPSVTKKIIDGEFVLEANEASIGDKISYRITGTLPTNIDDYGTYYYCFTDTLSKGLTYKENSLNVLVVKADYKEIDVTKYFHKEIGTYDKDNGTTITVSIQDLKALGNLETVNGISAATKIIVRYDAELNTNAVIAGEGNKNTVKLDYSNDPNNSGEGSTNPPEENPDKPEPTHPTGNTPNSEVVTYTTELIISKVDQNNKILPGAEFTLTGSGVNVVLVYGDSYVEDENGTYWKLKDGTYTTTPPVTLEDETNNEDDYESTTIKYSLSENQYVVKDTNQTGISAVGTVDPVSGQIKFSGLGVGNYTIKETKTPKGYNTISDIDFTVTWTSKDGFTPTDPVKKDNNNNKLTITIKNKAGSTLPETGGMGTTVFYVLGGILVVGAAILLITRRRMNAEK